MPVLELDMFPEDIFQRIHSLMPLKDAARAACVSHRFLHSWRHFPNLTFNWQTLGFNINDPANEMAKKLVDRIQDILENHSGIGVEKFKLQVRPGCDVITANHLDGWLQSFVKSGIVELNVDLPMYPYLSPGNWLLRNLKRVRLEIVHITEEELRCFMSCAIFLEKLEVTHCHGITFLKIPSHLEKFHILRVIECESLQMIEIYAPKVATFALRGPPIKISISDSSQLKNVRLSGILYSRMFQYAFTKLHSIASNLQTLIVSSSKENPNMLVPPEKFLHLRHLKIYCFDIRFQTFDFFSLVSFLQACPALESFLLSAGDEYSNVRKDSILKYSKSDSLHMRQVPEFRYDNLKELSIAGFSSSKSLIELTCQILGNASSLQHLMLDTTSGYDNSGVCAPMETVIEALNGVRAIERYIECKVPSNVDLEVLKPCVKCHISKL